MADNKPDKYVCPSDRQLALRAKLQTGWSCGKTEPLKPEEQQKILEVIQRNELLEMAERKRIGKLVERVHRIKKLACECGPKNCRLCGQAFGMLGPSKLICDDCCKPVCSKCSIELNSKTDHKKEMWLCKICSETREMWKKTGAWFFHGLPQYELPQKPLPKGSTQLPEAPTRVIKTTKLGMQIEESSEEDEYESVCEHDTALAGNRMTKNCRNFFGLRLPNNNSNATCTTYINDTNGLPGKSPNSSNDSQKSASSSSHNDWEVLPTNNRRGSSVQQMVPNATARKSSITSSWSVSEASSIGMFEMMFAQGLRDQHFPGSWLEIILVYEESDYVLCCTVARARDLPAMDKNGLADPFCKLNIITQENHLRQKKWERTKTVHSSRNPEFNECIKFCGIGPDESLDLYVVLLDDDKYGYDLLGSTKIPLTQILNCGPRMTMTIPLDPNPDDDDFCHDAMISGPWPNGRILISISYNTKKRALIVLIKECKDLTAMDKNGFSDPFVKLQLKPDSHRKKFKSSIKWRTLSPVWNEEFLFETRPNDLDKQSLIITVWDKDIGKSNDFLGSLVLGCNSKGRRLKQWKNLVLVPDCFSTEWHYLSNELPKHF